MSEEDLASKKPSVLYVKPRRVRLYNKISRDDSIDPVYTDLALPYRVICRLRYLKEVSKQDRQFLKEIKRHELMQSKALDGVRIHREFVNPCVKPIKKEDVIRLTPEQKYRLDLLLY